MVDGLALCSCACVACLWCSVLALCFPKLFTKLQESDSNIYCSTVRLDNSKDKKIIPKVIERCESPVNYKHDDCGKNGKNCFIKKPKYCTVKIVRKTRLKDNGEGKLFDDHCGTKFSKKKEMEKSGLDSAAQTDRSRPEKISDNTKNRNDQDSCDCNHANEDSKKLCKAHDVESDESLIIIMNENAGIGCRTPAALEDRNNRRRNH